MAAAQGCWLPRQAAGRARHSVWWPAQAAASRRGGRGGGKGVPAHARAGVSTSPTPALGFSQRCPLGLLPALPVISREGGGRREERRDEIWLYS